MKVLIVGAGAIGQWIGTNLIQAGVHVAFAGRAAFAEAARRDGLHVHLPNGDAWHLQNVKAFESVAHAAEMSPFDAIALCVKAYSVEEAVIELRDAGMLAPDAVVICFQNGLGAEDVVARMVGADRVIAGTLTSAVSLIDATTVKLERAKGGVGLAVFAGSSMLRENSIPNPSPLKRVANAILSAPMLNARIYAEASAMKWSKLLLNLVGNATSAVFRRRVADLLADDFTAQVEMAQLREAERVMRAAGVHAVNLPGAPAKWFAIAIRILPDPLLRFTLQRFLAKARGDKFPSFYYDAVNQTGRSEVAWLNGAICAWGRRMHVPTPVNDALTHLVQDAVKGNVLSREQIARELNDATAKPRKSSETREV
jgi:2-dehydropantoate 2-reductase